MAEIVLSGGKVILRGSNPVLREASSSAAALQTFTLHNWGATPSKVRWLQGLPFRHGHVGASQGFTIAKADSGVIVTHDCDIVSSYPDGSLRYAAVMLADDEPIPAGGSRTYRVDAADGATRRPARASGLDLWAWLAAATDLNVAMTGMTGSSSGALTDRSIRLGRHSRVATRRTLHTDGRRAVSWSCWGMAHDEASGREDGHLKGNHYGWVFLDAAGEPIGMWYVCVVAQDWYAADPLGSGEPAEKRTYRAALRNGGVTLAAYAGGSAGEPVDQPYRSAWCTVRIDDDPSHAQPQWIGFGEPMPTLWAEIDSDYWSLSGVIPPIGEPANPETWPALSSLSSSGQTTSCATYYPGREIGHRADADGTGSYRGRGIITHFDSIRLWLQSPVRDRECRVAAYAGFHIPGRYVATDARRRSRDGIEAADVSNDLIPMRRIQAGVETSASYQGFPTSRSISFHDASPRDEQPAVPRGGESSNATNWHSSPDCSHVVVHCYFAAALSGQRHLVDQTIKGGYLHAARFVNGDWGLLYGPPYVNRSGVPTTSWRPVLGASQTRHMAWGLWGQWSTLPLMDDADIRKPLCYDIAKINLDYYWTSMKAFPADQQALGAFYGYDSSDIYANVYPRWQEEAFALAAYQIFDTMREERALELGHYCSRTTIKRFEDNPGATVGIYGYVGFLRHGPWDGAGIAYSSRPLQAAPCDMTAGSDWITVDQTICAYPAAGASVYVTAANYAGAGLAMPAPFEEGVLYQIAEADWRNLRIKLKGASTAVITPTTTRSRQYLAFDVSNAPFGTTGVRKTTVFHGSNGLPYTSESFDIFALAAFRAADRHACPHVTAKARANARTWFDDWAPGRVRSDGYTYDESNWNNAQHYLPLG